MSFPTYPAYKDSGVEWLGSVPEHWAIFSLKRSVDGCTNGLWGDEPDGENDLAVIRVADFDRATCRVGLDKLTYRSITQKERASRLLQSGDLLIEKSGGGEKTLVGCVVLFEHEFEAVTSNFVARMRPLPSFDSGFLCYAFDSLYQGKVNFPAIKQTTGIQNLDSESYLQERFCFPTLAEQTQIARFLDHETARIDALIEEQQRLIELLKEKRQAVISHAVTKGLDPTVPMKDSGVEWLGEVPAHWEVRSISLISNKITNGFVGPTRDILVDEPGVRYLQSLHIKSNKIKFEVPYYVSEQWSAEHAKSILASGDVLIVQTGDIGQVAVVTEEHAGCNCHALIIVSPVRGIVLGEWMSWALNSTYGYHSLLSIQTGAMHPHLNCGNVKFLNLPIPPLEEQARIVSFIESGELEMDSLMSETKRSLLLLQERRSALISAAVTGKIDVRGWQPPASAKAPEHTTQMTV
ncbi:restriction endonuclease subunit S [Pseudomonas aeruginosa]|uniref:restriction endonuclease subunit S n=1 Tax=Pseudomonas aeruginosa TaxID=287 RepID=UPI00104A9338|nr:restriction endonuclease subunit S [Pseudomonas aeruginosa]